MDIVNAVVVGKDHHQDVADAYSVKTRLVSHLVRKARVDPQYLRRQLQQQTSQVMLRDRIEREVLQQLDLAKPITSASQVRNLVQLDPKEKISLSTVQAVLK